MSRRRPKRQPDPRRGRHKKAASRETAVWEAEHLIPQRPDWMPPQTYERLADLRRNL